jgi:hypothetical protein
MSIFLEYQIIQDYFSKKITWNDVKTSISVAFNFEPYDYKYYQLEYNDPEIDKQDFDYFKSKIIKSSSKLAVYYYFLFKNDEEPFNQCINYWLNNNENISTLSMDYTIDNILEEMLLEKNGKDYIDMVCVFDKFFSQNSNGFYLREVREPEVITI